MAYPQWISGFNMIFPTNWWPNFLRPPMPSLCCARWKAQCGREWAWWFHQCRWRAGTKSVAIWRAGFVDFAETYIYVYIYICYVFYYHDIYIYVYVMYLCVLLSWEEPKIQCLINSFRISNTCQLGGSPISGLMLEWGWVRGLLDHPKPIGKPSLGWILVSVKWWNEFSCVLDLDVHIGFESLRICPPTLGRLDGLSPNHRHLAAWPFSVIARSSPRTSHESGAVIQCYSSLHIVSAADLWTMLC